MQEQEKKNFKAMMDTLMDLYNKPHLSQDLLRVWWDKLNKFEFHQVSKAIDDHVNQSAHIPTPFDIIKLCPSPHTFTALPPPIKNKAESKVLADNVMKFISDQKTEIKKDFKAWAKRIIANPQKYPAISLKFANEAIRSVK